MKYTPSLLDICVSRNYIKNVDVVVLGVERIKTMKSLILICLAILDVMASSEIGEF